METKLSKLKAAAARGDWREAPRIAARFPNLGTHKADIKRAHEAYENGEFYRQLGRDPHALIEAGKAALTYHYNLTKDEDTAMTTTLTATQIAALTAILTGETKRAANRDAAERRFRNVAGEHGLADQSGEILSADFDAAAVAIRAAIEPDFGPSPNAEEAAAGEAEAARNCPPPVAVTVDPAADGIEIPPFLRRGRRGRAAAGRGTDARRADGRTSEDRAAVRRLEGSRGRRRSRRTADRAGLLRPVARRYRKRLGKLVLLAEAGDAVGLELFRINPISSSPIAMAKCWIFASATCGVRAVLPVAA